MKPTPTVQELQDPARYRLLERLAFERLLPFIWRWYGQKASWITLLHFALTLAPAVWLVAALVNRDGRGSPAKDLAWSLAGLLVLLPLHELIHAAAFRLAGVKDIRFGFTLKELTLYTIAHNSPLSAPAFPLAALAPSLALTPPLLAAALWSPELRVIALALLALHTSAAVGDIALVNYFYLNRGLRIWTFDDADSRETFFYAAREQA